MRKRHCFRSVHHLHLLSISSFYHPFTPRARPPSISRTSRCVLRMISEMYNKGNISTLNSNLRSEENNYMENLSKKQPCVARTTSIGRILRYRLACHRSGDALVIPLKNFRLLRLKLPNHPTFRSPAPDGTERPLSLYAAGSSSGS